MAVSAPIFRLVFGAETVDEGESVDKAGPAALVLVIATLSEALRERAGVLASAGVVENPSGATKTQSTNPIYSTKEDPATE